MMMTKEDIKKAKKFANELLEFVKVDKVRKRIYLWHDFEHTKKFMDFLREAGPKTPELINRLLDDREEILKHLPYGGKTLTDLGNPVELSPREKAIIIAYRNYA